jgi:hypothetical protein
MPDVSLLFRQFTEQNILLLYLINTQIVGQLASYSLIPSHMVVISDIRCLVDENCTLLGYYAALNGNHLPLPLPCKGLPFNAA